MSFRQAKRASDNLSDPSGEGRLLRAELTGYSVFRGLTFLELRMTFAGPPSTRFIGDLLCFFIVEAEAADEHNDELYLLHAETFPEGHEHSPQQVSFETLAGQAHMNGSTPDTLKLWSELLGMVYNPVTRPAGEVRIRKRQLK